MLFPASRKDLKENRGNKNKKDHKSQFLVAKTCVKNQRETQRGACSEVSCKFFEIEYFGGVGLLVNEIHLSNFL